MRFTTLSPDRDLSPTLSIVHLRTWFLCVSLFYYSVAQSRVGLFISRLSLAFVQPTAIGKATTLLQTSRLPIVRLMHLFRYILRFYGTR